jgi:hypothetical protein
MRYLATPPSLSKVVSEKVHGSSGTFDIDLTSGNAIECRSGGANGDYSMVFTFINPVSVTGGPAQASVTSGTGVVTDVTVNGTEITVNLGQVLNAQKIMVTLFSVSDGTHTGDVSASMNVLIGDTNGDGVVNSADIGQTKSQSGHSVGGTNFREDLNADGVINSADIGLVKSRSGTGLP